MKLFNKIFAALLLLPALTFMGCTEETEYTPASAETGDEVYFISQGGSVALEAGQSSIPVVLHRVRTTDALTVSLQGSATADDAISSVFTFPSSVSFPAGQDEVETYITFNFSDIVPDQHYTLTYNITSDTTPYGNAQISWDICFENWIALGTGTFVDGIMDPLYGCAAKKYAVEIDESGSNPGYYRIKSPYGAKNWGQASELSADAYMAEDEYIYVDATDPEHVYFNAQSLSSFDLGGGETYAMNWGGYYEDYYGYSRSSINSWGSDYTGYMQDGIIYVGNILVDFADWGWYYYSAGDANAYYFNVALPGYTIADYSATVTYAGRFEDPSGNLSAYADVVLGADVSSARLALVTGKSLAEAYQAVENGTVDFTDVNTSGRSEIPMVDPVTGTYFLILVAYDADGNVQAENYASFKYTSGQPEWESMGKAIFQDGFIMDLYQTWYGDDYSPAANYVNVEIEKSTVTEGLYRLVNPYKFLVDWGWGSYIEEGVDTYLEIHAEDPDGVYINYQSSGVNLSGDDIYIYSYAAWYMDYDYSLDDVKSWGYTGTLKDGKITFPKKTLRTYWGSDGYDSNANGEFLIDMSGLLSASGNVARMNTRAATRTAPSKAPARKMTGLSRQIRPSRILKPMAAPAGK